MASPLRLVIVTPERTLFDEVVQSLRFPLYDGEIGVLPGRLPVIGRLGTGTLRVRLPANEERTFFIDGGFVQISRGVVTLLTQQAIPVDQVSREQAERELAAARQYQASTDAEFEHKFRQLQRARRLLAMTKHQT
ncbi:MAG: ATP synthase epsilon chain [Planctomycetaceae bacterium]|nr:MAG: ATP synthase epsilon chain [Planctomycetaceae bacterium]